MQATSGSARLRYNAYILIEKRKALKKKKSTKEWESLKLELSGRRCRSSLSRRPLRSRWGRDSEIVQVGEGWRTGYGGGGTRIGLSVRNEMRIAKEEEKSAVIKIHERHIASVVVGQWLGGGARERGRGFGGRSGGGRTGINRIVSIHPSGSSRDLDAPISLLHCLACRITRPRPPSLLTIAVSFPRLEKCSFTLFIVYRLSFSLGRPVTIFLSSEKSMRRYSLAT